MTAASGLAVGEYILIRPDPQVVWKGMKSSPLWKSADGVYLRSNRGGRKMGRRQIRANIPDEWVINYRDLRLICRPTGFQAYRHLSGAGNKLGLGVGAYQKRRTSDQS